MASYGCQHHVTGVYRVNEIGREGASLAHPLNGASICLMNQDDPLQESLHMSLALHAYHHVSQRYIAVYTIRKSTLDCHIQVWSNTGLLGVG